MNKADHIKIAKALGKARPRDLFINEVARLQWYADVSAIANTLSDEAEVKGTQFNADGFFNEAGVPS